MKALITGAGSGIGRDMARYLDKKGIELIVVDRNEQGLKDLKEELGKDIKIVVADLSKKENVFEVYDKCKDDNIDILINNAGFGLFGEFCETDLDTELSIIDVNVRAPHILTKLFLKDFVKRDSGYILNVASAAGFMAGPTLNTYYATKNYILKLTEAINEELRQKKSNVYIGALCPGPVETNFNNVAKGSFAIKGASSEYVARYGIDKMFKKKMIIIPTLIIKLGIFSLRLLPVRAQLAIAYRIQKSKQK